MATKGQNKKTYNGKQVSTQKTKDLSQQLIG